MALLFYTTYISVDFTHHEILRAKVGKGGIIAVILHTQLQSEILMRFN